MARLLFFGLLVLAFIACLVIIVSAATRALDAGGRALGTAAASGRGEIMVPTTFQKIAYAALAILLLGVSVGWLGGM
ncbi:hypothetical protein K1T73_14700 [Roseovarius sp. SCSIO 43702]|uniref:hypothetical protein n=1 Tax=Roseovarius sp. SCSIO 43702 TaxID=2823043 RepID=UPI001C7350DD|nr:hypothetical protein [Roseovarius sp. SCSIO 43702]QYX56291.1 hypothetical protein K1T73_14700 [Roseovarius sp. SCSIO 43702]